MCAASPVRPAPLVRGAAGAAGAAGAVAVKGLKQSPVGASPLPKALLPLNEILTGQFNLQQFSKLSNHLILLLPPL